VAILKLTLINAIDLLIMKSQKLSRLLISGNGSEPVGLLGKLIHKTTLNPKDLLNPDPAVFDISHLPLGSQQENPLTAYPQIFNNHHISTMNRCPMNLATSGTNRRGCGNQVTFGKNRIDVSGRFQSKKIGQERL